MRPMFAALELTRGTGRKMTLRTGYGRGSPQWAAAAGDDTKGVDATVSGGLAPHFRLLELGGGSLTPSRSSDVPNETNGVAERFFRTFKEQVVHGRIYQTIDDVRAAVRKFFELYNAEWLIENGLRSPRQTRFAWQQASMARLRPWLFARIWYETKRKLNSLLWSGVSRVSTTPKGRSDLCCPPWQCPLYLCSSAGRQINDLVASVTRIVIWIGYSRFGL
jgi:hypothetical protein